MGYWTIRIIQHTKSNAARGTPKKEVYCETATTLFSTKIPIAGVAGDQQAALFGQLCTKPGMAKKHLWNRLFYVNEYW
jgi:glycerol kinase